MPRPVRSCAACRTRRPKPELLRFAALPGGVVVDPGARQPGRGGYTCRKRECVDDALRRGGLARVLRVRIAAGEAARLRREAVEYL